MTVNLNLVPCQELQDCISNMPGMHYQKISTSPAKALMSVLSDEPPPAVPKKPALIERTGR
jgi:hypothetical protein